MSTPGSVVSTILCKQTSSRALVGWLIIALVSIFVLPLSASEIKVR